MYFPSDLWPQTNVILLEAQRKFPLQTQTLELCKHIISEMTPIFREAVSARKTTANAVLNEGLGGMRDLLRLLLIRNDDSPKSGFFSFSNQSYQLEQKVTKSDEWLKMSKAIAEAQHKSTVPDNAKNAKTVKSVDTEATAHRAMVDAYIEEVRSKKSKRITRKDIWTAAGYKTRTEFERWERRDSKRPNKADDEIFRRILSVEKPHLK